MEQNYFAIIPAKVRYDNNLKANEKLLFGEITCLLNATGVCYATNDYFAKLYDTTERSVRSWVEHLRDAGYIRCEYIKIDENVTQRNIYVLVDIYGNGGNQKAPKVKRETKSFIKPTVDEIKTYCLERKNNVDANKFFDYYESKGWVVGRTKMKDWKASVRTWERNNYSSNNQKFKTGAGADALNASIDDLPF